MTEQCKGALMQMQPLQPQGGSILDTLKKREWGGSVITHQNILGASVIQGQWGKPVQMRRGCISGQHERGNYYFSGNLAGVPRGKAVKLIAGACVWQESSAGTDSIGGLVP